MTCRCGCHRRAEQRHHIVYQQELRRLGGDKAYGGNMIPVAAECHARHHNRSRPLTLHVLPDTAFAYARKLMGAGAAYEYLRRRYAGTDARLDALLEEWEQAA